MWLVSVVTANCTEMTFEKINFSSTTILQISNHLTAGLAFPPNLKQRQLYLADYSGFLNVSSRAFFKNLEKKTPVVVK